VLKKGINKRGLVENGKGMERYNIKRQRECRIKGSGYAGGLTKTEKNGVVKRMQKQKKQRGRERTHKCGELPHNIKLRDAPRGRKKASVRDNKNRKAKESAWEHRGSKDNTRVLASPLDVKNKKEPEWQKKGSTKPPRRGEKTLTSGAGRQGGTQDFECGRQREKRKRGLRLGDSH